MTKHILIDGTPVSRRMDGLSQYILNVVSCLPQRADTWYTIVLRPGECSDEYAEKWQRQGKEVLFAPIDPIGPGREYQFRRWLRTQPAFDAALIPSNQYPVFLPVPSVYVVHDLIYERYPDQLGRWAYAKRWWLHHNVAKGLQAATVVVAVSEYTRNEILRCHPTTDVAKIKVVYEGWEHLQQPVAREPLNLPLKDYILYVGNSRGHKNLQGLLDAMTIAQPYMNVGQGLVIAGDDRWLNKSQRAQIAALNGKVVTTGWLTSAQLDACYRQAKAVVFPSLSEGFGIPVLEAFYYGKPLLVSKAASFPEVAGEAALYFNPVKPTEIAEKLIQALAMTEEERQQWADRGAQRLNTFSWQKTADEIETILQEICPIKNIK